MHNCFDASVPGHCHSLSKVLEEGGAFVDGSIRVRDKTLNFMIAPSLEQGQAFHGGLIVPDVSIGARRSGIALHRSTASLGVRLGIAGRTRA